MANAEQTRKSIDYAAAAEQLLAVLAGASRLANTDPALTVERPLAAATLARLVFGFAVSSSWTHETRRRRIRDTAVVARQLLARDQASAQICADTVHGYWLASDPAQIAAYAARRRRAGLTHLAAAAHQVTPTLAPAAGQTSLLPSVVPVPSPALPCYEVCDCGHSWTTHSSAGCHGHHCECRRVGPTPGSNLFPPLPRSTFRH